MKSILAYLLLLISLSSQCQPIKFNVKYSKEVAVFEFVGKLVHADENIYKKIFGKSRFNTTHYKDLIKAYDSLNLFYALDYNGYPYAHKMPGMTIYWLKRNCILSNSFDDFKNRSMGLIPNETLLRLVNILKEFTPVYEELIYQPYKLKFNKNLFLIKKEIKTKELSKYFYQALEFYNSSWNKDIPLEICYYPLPSGKETFAYAFINNAISQLPITLKDYDGMLTVMLHETSHILYDEETPTFQNEIESWFHDNSSQSSTYAYWILNEVLATTIGNGYVAEQMSGHFVTGEWIDQKYIDTLSKSIYPMLKQYFKEGKSIDKKFIDNYIAIYEQQFPNFIHELGNILSYRYTIASKNKISEMMAEAYPYVSYEIDDDEITAISFEKMKSKHATKTIVISKNNNLQLTLIKHAFPELNNWQFESNSNFIKVIFLEDKTYLFIINGKTEIEAEDLLNTLLKNKIVNLKLVD